MCLALRTRRPASADREREKVYSPRYNNTAVKLTASKHKVEGCQKGIKPILAGHPGQGVAPDSAPPISGYWPTSEPNAG